MRISRTFLRQNGCCFHVVSRIVDKAFRIGEAQKARLHKALRKLERFSGVQVLTYCLMDNHIHLLLRTEAIDGESLSDEELVRRIGGLYSPDLARELKRNLDTWRERKHARMVAFWRDKYLARLGNLSEFMWVLKNKFSKWYNLKHDREGTLWEGRYKVVMVQDSARVLMKVAAYIDLNPVRAGLVGDPGTYRWCGYGEALGGGTEARRGIRWLMGACGNGDTDGVARLKWKEALESYRALIFEEGEGRGLAGEPGAKVEVLRDRFGNEVKRRGAISTELVDEVARKQRGKLSLAELLRCRVRYMTAGAIIGTREYVNEKFKKQPKQERGKRKTGARKMRGGDWTSGEGDEALYALRDLQVDVVAR